MYHSTRSMEWRVGKVSKSSVTVRIQMFALCRYYCVTQYFYTYYINKPLVSVYATVNGAISCASLTFTTVCSSVGKMIAMFEDNQ